VSLCVIGEDGKPLFNEIDAKNILGRGSARVLDRIYQACQDLNGLRKEDTDELVKNSGSATSGASGSSSPPASA
jgi:hypothetical protein